MKNAAKFITSIIVCQLAGLSGLILATPAISGWYSYLQKPSFNPPDWIFGPAWTILYLLMGISLYIVWSKNWVVRDFGKFQRKAWNHWSEKLWVGSWKKQNLIAIFILQLVLNALWTVIFFGLKSPGLAFFEILMIWFAILYTIVNFYRVSKLAALLLVPYISWVSFAAVLNLAVWQVNYF